MKLRALILVLFLELLLSGVWVQGATQVQTVTLATNWNLISFYVQPSNAAPAAVFTNLIQLGRLVSVFGYDYASGGTTGVWTRFYPGLSSDRAWLNTLGQVRVGQGYWVNVTRGPTVNLSVTGSVTSVRSSALQPGWNLIGLGNDRRVFWADAFGSLAGGLQSLYGYSPAGKAFTGFSQPVFGPADVNGNGQVEFGELDWTYANEAGALRYIEAGQGVWVKVSDATDVAPVLEVEVESDVDGFAPGATANTWFEPGIDTDINGNGVLDYGFSMPDQWDEHGNEYLNTQDTIWFRVPTGAANSNVVVLHQDITVLNKEGRGMLFFEVDKDVPWLTISLTNGAVLPGPGGQVVALQADLAGLPIGEQVGTLRVRSNGGTNTYTVKLTVPEMDGLYGGEITQTNLQGRLSYPLTWPVQMRLNLRGQSVLQASGSPNFPVDIVLTNSGSATNFDLNGTVSLNAGAAGNPFNVAVQRSVRFRGARIVPAVGQTVGMNLGLTGAYEEVLTGLPSGPLLLNGFFSLNPKTDKTPLEEP